jgi:hypothetical protein
VTYLYIVRDNYIGNYDTTPSPFNQRKSLPYTRSMEVTTPNQYTTKREKPKENKTYSTKDHIMYRKDAIDC